MNLKNGFLKLSTVNFIAVFLLKQVNRDLSSLKMAGSCKMKVTLFQHSIFPWENSIYPVNGVIL